MKFFIPAFLVGIILNFFIYNLEAGTEIYPQWTGALPSPEAIQQSPELDRLKEAVFPYRYMDNLYIINARGVLSRVVKAEGNILAPSGNGKYYISYEKVGKEIQFYDMSGAPYWKMNSREYPYVSYNGKLLILLNGDHSRIRLADFNGNIIGAGEISGRLCTVISFSQNNDNGAAGFADGAYYFINHDGMIINQGLTPGLTVVKTIAVSDNAHYGAVHYGDTQNDYLLIINFSRKSMETVKLKMSHIVKCPLYIADNGVILIIEKEKLVKYSSQGEVVFELSIPEMKGGQGTINYDAGYYAISYSGITGSAYLGIVSQDGEILFLNEYINDASMFNMFTKGLIVAKGSSGLYCYSIHSSTAQK